MNEEWEVIKQHQPLYARPHPIPKGWEPFAVTPGKDTEVWIWLRKRKEAI